jgi:hypothetical protein
MIESVRNQFSEMFEHLLPFTSFTAVALHQDLLDALKECKDLILDVRVKSRRKSRALIEIEECCEKTLGFSQEDIADKSHPELLQIMKHQGLHRKEYEESEDLLKTNMKLLLRKLFRHFQVQQQLSNSELPGVIQAEVDKAGIDLITVSIEECTKEVSKIVNEMSFDDLFAVAGKPEEEIFNCIDEIDKIKDDVIHKV